MGQIDERDPCEFFKYPTVAVHVKHKNDVETFYLHSSFLDKYTNLLNDPFDAGDLLVTGKANIHIQANVETFWDFVNWLYRGPEAMTRHQASEIGWFFPYLWLLACRLEAEGLNNQMVDHVQGLLVNDDFIKILRGFEVRDLGDSALVAYMLEKVVYEIVDDRPHFRQAAGKAWDTWMGDSDASGPIIKRISRDLKVAHKAKEKGRLKDPATRMTCKYHEHNGKNQLDCPRYHS